MLRKLQAWIKPGECVYEADIYSDYASIINHVALIQQLKTFNGPRRYLTTLIAYCERTILRIETSISYPNGMPKEEGLLPVLSASCLTLLDRTMERWTTCRGCFCVRLQDDSILISHKRRILKRIRKEILQLLRSLQLILKPEKALVGRNQESFDLERYYITPQGFSPNQETLEKALEKAKRHYAWRDKKLFPRISIGGKPGFMLAFLSKLIVLMMSSSLLQAQSQRTHR